MTFWISLSVGTILFLVLLGYLWLKYKPIYFAPFVISIIALGMNVWTLTHQKSVNVNFALINAELQTLKAQVADIDKLKSKYAEIDELKATVAQMGSMTAQSLHAGPTIIDGGLTIRSRNRNV